MTIQLVVILAFDVYARQFANVRNQPAVPLSSLEVDEGDKMLHECKRNQNL